ncbi:DNA repair protein RecO [Candidatus Saccharibacteria bacterium]|nr:DNA repair protein RecO [Candidatus Saccharibacteria bacterium]
MNNLATSGIILRRIEYGEADRIITFLTAEYGKMTAIAKGVRKQNSKLAGGVELFSVSELHFIKGRKEIDTLVSTRLQKHFGSIVKDVRRTEIGFLMLKVAYKTIEDGAGQEYYPVLEDGLSALNELSIPAVLSELSFDMRVLQLLGHVPKFNVDQKGDAIGEADSYQFDFDLVKFIPAGGGLFTKNHVKLLRLLAHNSPLTLKAVQNVEQYCDDLAPLVRHLAQQYLPIVLQT